MHATSETEKVIFHTKPVFLIQLPLCSGLTEVIPVSEVLGLLSKINYILDRACSTLVGNSAHILAILFI